MSENQERKNDKTNQGNKQNSDDSNDNKKKKTPVNNSDIELPSFASLMKPSLLSAALFNLPAFRLAASISATPGGIVASTISAVSSSIQEAMQKINDDNLQTENDKYAGLVNLFPPLINLQPPPNNNLVSASINSGFEKHEKTIMLKKYLIFDVDKYKPNIVNSNFDNISKVISGNDLNHSLIKCLELKEEVSRAIYQFEKCDRDTIKKFDRNQKYLQRFYPDVLYLIEREYDFQTTFESTQCLSGELFCAIVEDKLKDLKYLRGLIHRRIKSIRELLQAQRELRDNSTTQSNYLTSLSNTDLGDENLQNTLKDEVTIEDEPVKTEKPKLPRKIKKSISKVITPERAVMYLGTIKKCRVTNNIRASCFEDAKIHGEDQRNYYGAFHGVYRRKFNFSYGQMEESLKDLIKQSKKKSKKMGNFNN